MRLVVCFLGAAGVSGLQMTTIERAQRYLSLGNKVEQQLGPTSPAVLEAELADDFEFVAPLVGPLSKKALIEATQGLDLAAAMPDFNANYHDFRVDPDDESRVWCTMRVKATQTGTLNFGGVKAPPQSPPLQVESPPEAVSLRFDASGKLRELTTGYPLDRRVGNTGGLGGLFGVLEGLGAPLPIPLTRPTAELLEPLLRAAKVAPPSPPKTLLALPTFGSGDALPQEALLEKTQALFDSNFGVESPEMLADGFTFTGPVIGPLQKSDFLSTFAGFNLKEAMPDLDFQYRDLRVCPFDVNRVWYTSSPTGTHSAELRLGDRKIAPTGRRWESPPECGSVIFNSAGEVVSLTGGYVMDRRMGNTDGLGGVFGLCVALGVDTPFPAWLLRTPVQNAGRLKDALVTLFQSDNPELLDLFELEESYEKIGKTGQKIG